MKLRISHLTRYEYAQVVAFSPHTLYLRPRETPLLRVSRFSYNISPQAKITPAIDPYDNVVTQVHLWDRANALSVRTEFEVETLETNPFDFILRSDAVAFPCQYQPYERYVLAPYLASPAREVGEGLRQWLSSRLPDWPSETVPLVSAVNQTLFESIQYARRDEPGVQPARVTVESGTGACRDYAVAFVEVCRTLGLAARFVSGYLHAEPDDGRHAENAMHAWAEVYLPGAGWKGIDPSHGIFCTDAYVPVAHAPVPEAVSPVQGSYYSPVRVPSQLTTTVLVERV